VAGTIADITATEPSFTVERFEPVGDRLEVAGHWQGLRGRRFVRPVLWLHNGESRRRVVAVLDHKPWSVGEGDLWIAAFAWSGGKLDADRAELEVGSDLVVDLPVPGARKKAAAEPRPAMKRKLSEAELLREQLTAETKERRGLQTALDAVEREAGALVRMRAERDAAREDAERARAERDAALADAERARADGERLVNDEYRQRARAQQAADEAAAARDLAERQLAAARESHAALEQRLAAAEAARDRLVAEVEGLRDQLAAAHEDRDREPAPADTADRDRLEAQLVAGRAERERLEGELAGAWAERDRAEADLHAARDGRERVEAELVAARADRKRLEREVTGLREESSRRPRRPQAAPAPDSRIAPPRDGPALWVVRAVASVLVAILLVAIVLALGALT
jgi:chromosome segregation ATPase